MEWTPQQEGLREILTLLKESQSPDTATQRTVQQVSFLITVAKYSRNRRKTPQLNPELLHNLVFSFGRLSVCLHNFGIYQRIRNSLFGRVASQLLISLTPNPEIRGAEQIPRLQ